MLRAIILLAVSILTLSQAGNLIRLCHAPPPVVAFYRLLFAFIILLPVLIVKVRKTKFDFTKLDFFQYFVMGTFFALHFFTWISAIQHTTVANAAILFSSAPLMTAMGAKYFFKESVHRAIKVAMVTGILGILITGVGDLSFESQYLFGDVMGLLAAFFFALYFLMGKVIKRASDFFVTMPLIFFSAACVSLVVIILQGLPLTGFDHQTWLGFIGLAIFPTIIGHGLLIYSLHRFSSSTISTLTLVEPIFAALGAWFFYAEKPLWYAMIGYIVMACGLSYLFNYARLKSDKFKRG